MTIADPLWLAFLALTLAVIVSRRRRGWPLAVEEALRRVRAGERAVRIEAGAPGLETRQINRFNALAAQVEAGNFELAAGSDSDAALFEALRGSASEQAANAYVAVVEVDRFAALRQSIGYQLANAIMAALAERLSKRLPDAEIGRIGRTNIEFAFSASSSGDGLTKLLKVIEPLEERIVIDGFTLDLTVHVGFADAQSSSIRDELVDRAAAALAFGRTQRVKVCFADEAVLSNQGVADLDLMRLLPAALKTGEIKLFYQPKLDARENTFKAVEALLRWHHPERGLIRTDQLISLAEETGAIRDITEWVIARAAADQQRMAAEGHDIEVYVNISGQLLPDGDFADIALRLANQAPGMIGFEITETAVIGDPDAALGNLRKFVAAGIKIAIDDYGSGLSSLAYLKQLPANELKIDQMFVSGLTDSNRDPLLVRSSIDLAHALEMEVTAEGVDDAMALCLLRVMGCDLLQGYYISPPLPLDELLTFLNDADVPARLAAPDFAAGDWQQTGTA